MDKKSLEILKEIKNITDKKLTLESVFFDEDNSFDEYDDNDVPSKENNENESNDFMETVNNIRTIALNGVTQFANNPSSMEYDFFKKVWNMCDKISNPKQKNSSE